MFSTKSIRLFLIAALLGVFTFVSQSISPAYAAAFTVDSVYDVYDKTPGDGICAADLGYGCTLRAAIDETNALAGMDVIDFAPALAGATFSLDSLSELEITDDVMINGSGQIIQASPTPGSVDARVMTISGPIAVDISNLTLQNGFCGGPPATVQCPNGPQGANLSVSQSMVTLTDVIVVGGSNNDGGGNIFNMGTLTLIRSSVIYGSANYGGGIANGMSLILEDATITDNGAAIDGGGIYNFLPCRYNGIDRANNRYVY